MSNVIDIIREFEKKLPKFPDGRIDYHSSKTAPVLNAFVKCKDKILLLKRSQKVRTYKGKWNSLGGYLDEPVPLKEKILEELDEELGVKENIIKTIKEGESFTFEDKEIGMIWIIFPVVVELKEMPEIKLDWEHTEYRWIYPKEIKNYDTVSKLEIVYNKVSSL